MSSYEKKHQISRILYRRCGRQGSDVNVQKIPLQEKSDVWNNTTVSVSVSELLNPYERLMKGKTRYKTT